MSIAESFVRGSTVEFEIESIAAGGDAFARVDGLAVFADAGVPGDRVRGEVVAKRKRFARVRVDEIASQAAGAVEPECAVHDACGGCRFWRASDADELTWKVDATRAAIERLAREIEWPDHRVIASVEPRRYRHRARFRIGPDGEVGFLRRRSDSVVEGPDCLVLHSAIEAARPTIRALFRDQRRLDSVFVEYDAIREGVAITGEFPDRDLTAELRALRERVGRLGPLPDLTTVVVSSRRKRTPIIGDGCVWRRRRVGASELIVREPAAGFSQANAATNELLVAEVLAGLPNGDGLTALELFGGAGNFTFPLVGAGYDVDTIDIASDGVQAAATAWREWSDRPPRRVRFHAADLEKGVPSDLIVGTSKADVIVADPPRGGLSQALVADLRRVKRARHFVYVSCDPPAMARDVARLAEQGWKPSALTFVDMFPRTPHLEAVVALRRG